MTEIQLKEGEWYDKYNPPHNHRLIITSPNGKEVEVAYRVSWPNHDLDTLPSYDTRAVIETLDGKEFAVFNSDFNYWEYGWSFVQQRQFDCKYNGVWVPSTNVERISQLHKADRDAFCVIL